MKSVIPNRLRANHLLVMAPAVAALFLITSFPGISTGYAPVPFDRKSDAIAELVRLDGTWDLVLGMQHGEDVTETAQSTFLVVQSGRFRFRVRGVTTLEDPWDVKLNLRPHPKHIDLSQTVEGERRTLRGLYRLDGDTLTICLRSVDGSREARPIKLDGTETKTDRTWYQVFRRRKPPATGK